ncbi:MAG: 30S ribosomal protein S17e [Candidatus Brockarchaeota archaeon]|nr:30S ribosomal protein S17e [Candidatus Brockarchaeota archaeon]
MGRVYTIKIKRISKQVLADFPDAFSDDYEKNKELLKGILEVRSKKMLNQIAGYITKLKSSKSEIETADEAAEKE